jgi:hypothetical protein
MSTSAASVYMCRLISTSIEDELAELEQKAASSSKAKPLGVQKRVQKRCTVYLPPELVRWVPRDPPKSNLGWAIANLRRLQTPKLPK